MAIEHRGTVGPFDSLSSAATAGSREWLMQRTKTAKYAIVNPDIDGLLSFALLRSINPKLEIGGFYENEHQILVAEGLSATFREEIEGGFPSFLSIENDLLIMDSIGQHFCLLASPNVVRANPNIMRFGVAENVGFEKHAENFRNKYPFSTVFFMWILLGKKSFSDDEMIGLLYPDSAILKSFAHKYRENVVSWLEWMGVGNISKRFFELQGRSDIKQIARCLYKLQGSSQFGLLFRVDGETARIDNIEVAGSVLKFFCGLLSLDCPILDRGGYFSKSWHYARFNAERQPDLGMRKRIFANQLEINYTNDGRLKNKKQEGDVSTVRVISEALVTHGEWSVTTNYFWQPVSTEGIQVARRVVSGRNSELNTHVESLGLADPCVKSNAGCPFACGNCTLI